MSNPFAAVAAKSPNDNIPATPIQAPPTPPVATVPAPPAAAEVPAAPSQGLGMGDPFAAPKGIGDGERITDFVDRLLLMRPTEWIVQMRTSQGPSDACRVNMAVLDDPDEPGKVINGVLLFQQALRREAKAVLDGDLPFLLGRLIVTKTNGNNTLYLFEEANEADISLARQYLKARPGEL